MTFGAAWYPEHWPRERWQRDLELMRACGLELVRIAEFTWSKTQPSPGVWDWAWL
ncbi:MAG: beta-galactosidase, partial [Planctomycetota bacterium]